MLDTTGSMADLIDGAKRKIWSIASTIVDINPDAEIRMALIAYRDQGDEYVVKTVGMSADVQGLYGKLVRLDADGGGDTPESVNEALDEAVRKLSWTRDNKTRRIVFLVGDAPPHKEYDNAPKYPDVLKRAVKDGITVNAVQAGDDPDTRMVWREIAQLGHGRYIEIPQDGGQVTVIESPFDGDIIVLQRKIDETVLPYGDVEKQNEVHGKMTSKAPAPAPVQVDNSSFYSKRKLSKEVITGGGDLLADVKNGVRELDGIKDSELPDNLKDKSVGERKAEIDRRIAEREKLEASMAELVSKRDAYVSSKAKEETASRGGSFDRVVAETLKEQLR